MNGAATPWWDALPEDFFRQRNRADIDAEYWLRIRMTAGLDRFARSLASLLVSAMLAPSIATRRGVARERQIMQHHERLARLADSALTFAPPPAGVPVQSTPLRDFSLGRRAIPRHELRFASPFHPSHPDLAAHYERPRASATACAQHWTHSDGPRPILILIHGFAVDSYWLNARWFSLRWFYDQGYDILLYTLPFHGGRADNWDWFSGYGLFERGLAHFSEAMIHAVSDLRVLVDHLERRGATRIGVCGLSLGGYTSALLASVEPRLSFCIPICPVVSPIDLLGEWQPGGLLMGWLWRLHGLTPAQLRAATAVHNPLTYTPKIASERMLIISGAGDRFTPPGHVRLLHRHWPGSRLHWFPGSHLVHLRQAEYLGLMKTLMDRTTGGPHTA